MTSRPEIRNSAWRKSLAALLTLAVLASPAGAVKPDEILPDPAMEARARAISAGLRCLVCQNQSIDDSDAPLARDLRLLVRERLKAGDSDDAIESYVVQRYGEFVLLKPPLGWHTLLLWLMPLIVLASAIGVATRTMRWSLPRPSANRLSPEEEARIKRLTDEGQSS